MKELLVRNVLGLYVFKYLTIIKKGLFLLINKKNITQFHIDKTQLLFKKKLNENSNCIDVGASKGDILDLIINICPNGTHIAIEPIPVFASFLKRYYMKNNIEVFNALILNKKTKNDFYFVKNQPAISGVTDQNKPSKGTIKFKIDSFPLDYLVSDKKVDCIKIDCIGSELEVLRSAKYILDKHKPLLIFECTATHNTKESVSEIYKILTAFGYKIYTLKDFPKEIEVDLNEFLKHILKFNICDYYAC